MIHKKVPYILKRDGHYFVFESATSASEYLDVGTGNIVGCGKRGIRCKGYEVIRGISESEIYSDKRLRKIWESMHARCEYHKHPKWKHYGGRGISVCDEWAEYLPFAKWAVKNGYDSHLTIDRINNDGCYEPSNCRWATVKEQLNNTRVNHWVVANGERMTVAQCSSRYHVPESTIRWRDARGRDVLCGTRLDANDA